MRMNSYLLFSMLSHSSTSFKHIKESWRVATQCVVYGLDVKHPTCPYFCLPIHFRAIDFCGDLTAGSTQDLVERNIPISELLCRAGKGDETL